METHTHTNTHTHTHTQTHKQQQQLILVRQCKGAHLFNEKIQTVFGKDAEEGVDSHTHSQTTRTYSQTL